MKRVLIIDDDEGVRLTLTHVLSARGYVTADAADGAEGVQKASSFSPDIVLTDLLMPVQDGFETVAELKRLKPSLRVVAMSGGMRTGNDSNLEGALQRGADRVIAKPFDLPVLLEMIATLA